MFADQARDSSEHSSSDSDYESSLVDQAKVGESGVWERWFDEHYDQLYRYAYLRLRRKDDAEDLVAQVFLEAVKGIKRYEYKGRPMVAWLFGIAHNLLADHFKRQERRAAVEGPNAVSGATNAGIEERIENLDLLNALDRLTEEQRDVVILRFFMGMKTREIAELLDKSEVAVYSLQARAIAALRDSVGEVAS
jgi:RNA polymerase sigma-70 factor (ECF subfamily)